MRGRSVVVLALVSVAVVVVWAAGRKSLLPERGAVVEQRMIHVEQLARDVRDLYARLQAFQQHGGRPAQVAALLRQGVFESEAFKQLPQRMREAKAKHDALALKDAILAYGRVRQTCQSLLAQARAAEALAGCLDALPAERETLRQRLIEMSMPYEPILRRLDAERAQIEQRIAARDLVDAQRRCQSLQQYDARLVSTLPELRRHRERARRVRSKWQRLDAHASLRTLPEARRAERSFQAAAREMAAGSLLEATQDYAFAAETYSDLIEAVSRPEALFERLRQARQRWRRIVAVEHLTDTVAQVPSSEPRDGLAALAVLHAYQARIRAYERARQTYRAVSNAHADLQRSADLFALDIRQLAPEVARALSRADDWIHAGKFAQAESLLQQVRQKMSPMQRNLARKRDELHRLLATFVNIPAAVFMMGSAHGFADERPVHQVHLAAFSISKYEVTQDLWSLVMHDNPSHFTGDRRPVEQVSWRDVQTFIQRLNAMTGGHYRLPTEAEWEYAAGGGMNTPFATGQCIDTDHANYKGTIGFHGCGAKTGVFREQTVAVGSFPPNAFGLYDMHGNVWEWVADCYHASYTGAPADGRAWVEPSCDRHVLRGGSWLNIPIMIRTRVRDAAASDVRLFNVGFRLARDE